MTSLAPAGCSEPFSPKCLQIPQAERSRRHCSETTMLTHIQTNDTKVISLCTFKNILFLEYLFSRSCVQQNKERWQHELQLEKFWPKRKAWFRPLRELQHWTEVQRNNKISALGNPAQLSQTRSKNIKGTPQVSPAQSSWLPQKPPQVPSNLNPSVGMNHQVLLEKPYLVPSHSSVIFWEVPGPR